MFDRKLYMREWRSKNREKVNARNRELYSENRAARRKYARDWTAKNKERVAELRRLAGQRRYARGKETDPEGHRKLRREKYLWDRYRLSQEGLDKMLARQQGACAICRSALADGHARHIDHCHATGRVRGILCHGCNKGIGMFGDSADLCAAAAAYLRHYSLSPTERVA